METYLAHGYTTVVLTDHFSRFTFNNKKHGDRRSHTHSERVDFFLSGTEALKAAAGDSLVILQGCELRLNTDDNDYQIYGDSGEFLRANPDIMDIDVAELSRRVRDAGLLLIQAHPFRAGMMVTPVWQIDGIEVFNGHPGQSSFNDVAELYASHTEKFICTSGSDYHDDFHIPDAGILTANPITSNKGLIDVLARRDYSLIKDTDTMEAVRRSRG